MTTEDNVTPKPINGTKMTPENKRLYCQRLAETGMRTVACGFIGVRQNTVMNHIAADPDFAQAVEDAMACFRDKLEAEAIRRAYGGHEKLVLFKGELIVDPRKPMDDEGNPNYLTEKVFSDRLMELVLKRHIPEYRERSTIDANISGGVLVIPSTAASPASWEEEHFGERELPTEHEDE
jgi:hypothetical protein